MTVPRVSVVIPVYNCRAYVGETLRSVLAQEDVDLEVVCVDDGSTDGSADVIEACADPRVRLVRRANSGRPSVPRNAAIAHARGEYVAIFDSDDVMLAGKLARALEMLDSQPDVDWCFSDFRRMNETSAMEQARFLSGYPRFQSLAKRLVAPDAYRIAAEECFRGLAYENFVGTSSVVIRRSALQQVGGFDESLANGDDRDLWFRLARHGDALYLDRPLHLYRVRPGAVSRRGAVNAQARIRVLQKQLAVTRDRVLRRQFKRRIAENECGLGYDAKRRGAYGEARQHFLQAFRGHPSLRALRGLVGSVLRVSRT